MDAAGGSTHRKIDQSPKVATTAVPTDTAVDSKSPPVGEEMDSGRTTDAAETGSTSKSPRISTNAIGRSGTLNQESRVSDASGPSEKEGYPLRVELAHGSDEEEATEENAAGPKMHDDDAVPRETSKSMGTKRIRSPSRRAAKNANGGYGCIKSPSNSSRVRRSYISDGQKAASDSSDDDGEGRKAPSQQYTPPGVSRRRTRKIDKGDKGRRRKEGSSPTKDDVRFSEDLCKIQLSPPPRRLQYPGRKSRRGPSPAVEISMTDLPSTDSDRAREIEYRDTFGRCHLETEDSRFRWFSKGTIEDFFQSSFLGYNEGLGRVYFSSFFFNGKCMQVGDFILKWEQGSHEFFRIIGAFQATKSFMGDWPLKKRRKEHPIAKKEQIQKRGHPYIFVVPLKQKSDAESSTRPKRNIARSRIGRNSTSDVDTDFGFTTCCSEAEAGRSRLGTTRRKRAKLGDGGNTGQGMGFDEQVELMLGSQKSEAPDHVSILPEWLGFDNMTLSKIHVQIGNDDGQRDRNAGTGNERKRRAAGSRPSDETYICRRASLDPSKQRRSKAKRSDPPVYIDLNDVQYRLLTCPPNDLLRDFIPLTWDQRFDAVQVQFVREDRDWLEGYNSSWNRDSSKAYLHYTHESSDDSDEFDSHCEFPNKEDSVSGSEQLQTLQRRQIGPRENNEMHNVQMGSESEETRDEGISGVGPAIGIDDIRSRTESLFTGNQITAGMLKKQCIYLRKIASKPDREEALTELFLHKGSERVGIQEPLNEQEPQMVSNCAPHSVAYMVERKENSMQVSARMSHIVKNLQVQSNLQSRLKGLCYCLSEEYCRRTAKQFNKNGIAAKVLSAENIDADGIEQIMEGFRAGEFQVLCLTRGLMGGTDLPEIDFVFHVAIPASLREYADDTLLSSPQPPSVCILFYRPQDRIETERKVGLAVAKKRKGKGADTGTLLKGREGERAEKELNEVVNYCSDGSSCRVSKLVSYVGAEKRAFSYNDAACCDNCRLRLGQEGGIFSMKDENRTVSLGSNANSIKNVILCQVDITSFALGLLQRLQTFDTCSYVRVRSLALAVLEDVDSPLNVEETGNSREKETLLSSWASISAIRSLSLDLFRSRLIRIFIEQGIMAYPLCESGSDKSRYVIVKDRFDPFMAEVDGGNVAFCLRNVRLFASLFTDTSSPSATRSPGDTSAFTNSTFSDTENDAMPSGKSESTGSSKSQAKARLQTEPLPIEQANTINGNGRLDNDQLAGEPQDAAHVLHGLAEEEPSSDGVVSPYDTPRMPKMPLQSLDWLQNLPFLVQFELWRLQNDSSLDDSQLENGIRKHLENSQSNFDCHDACVFLHELAGTKESMHQYDMVTATASKSGLSVDTGPGSALMFTSTYSSTDTVTLQPPRKAYDCPIFNKFGSHRFLFVMAREDVPDRQLNRLIDRPRPITIAGRNYSYLWSDLRKSPQEFVLFAESGIGIDEDGEITVDDVREWCLPSELNQDLNVAREHLCIALYFAESTQSGILPAGSLDVAEGFAAASPDTRASGGCGLISQDALDFVWASYCSVRNASRNSDVLMGWDSDNSDSDSGCPHSSFQGSIGGMRGAWILDPSLGSGIKVLYRGSQLQFNVPMKSLTSWNETKCTVAYDNLYDTVQVESFDTCNEDGHLNLRFIQILEHRGVSIEFFKKYADEGTKRIAQQYQETGDLARKKAEVMRDTGSYPVKHCKYLRLIPDQSDLLKDDEAFVASSSGRDNHHIHKTPYVLVASSSSPSLCSDVVKFKLVNSMTLRDRAADEEASSSAESINRYEFFDTLQNGIVVNAKGKIGHLASAFGGDFFDRVWTCWDDKLISQVQDNEDVPDESLKPKLFQKGLLLSHEATAYDRVEYVTLLRLQFRRVKEIEAWLCTLNDMKGVDSEDGKKVATQVHYLQMQHPFQLYESEWFPDIYPTKLPHWQQASCSNSSSNTCKSEKALGELFDYMRYKISLLFRAATCDGPHAMDSSASIAPASAGLAASAAAAAPAPDIGPGWTVKSDRQGGGKVDKYWFSPKTERKFNSRAKARKFIEVMKAVGGDEDKAWEKMNRRVSFNIPAYEGQGLFI